jgi:hypothetical protein
MCFKSTKQYAEKYDAIEPPVDPVKPDVTSSWATHNDESFQTTLTWIETNVNANYGGTEMAVAVKSVYERLSSKNSNVIVMLTDAGIWGGQDTIIIEQVKNAEAKAEVFGLGIGASCSMSFLEKFTSVGNGISFHVSNSEDINDRTQRLMHCATQSQFLRNLTFEAPEYITLSTRKPVTSYFYGEPLNVFCKVEKSKFTGVEQLSLKSGDTVFMSLGFDKMVPSPVDLEMVFHMTYLDQLLKYPSLFKNNGVMSNEEYTKTVIEIGCKYNIVTQFTSAVLVRELKNADGSKTMQKVDIPIAIGKDKEQQPSYESINYLGAPMAAFGAPKGMRKTKARGFCEQESLSLASCNYSSEEGDDMDMGEMYEDAGLDYGSSFVDGMNTVGQTLHNTTQQLRSEPPAPQIGVSPFTGFMDARGDTSTFGLPLLANATANSADVEFDSMSEGDDEPTSYKTKEQNTPPTPTFTTQQLVEKLVLSQLSNGSWKFDAELLQHLAKESVDVYRKELTSVTDEDVFMTLMVMTFFNNHPEMYSTYNKSYKSAEGFVIGNVSDYRQSTLTLTQVGFN